MTRADLLAALLVERYGATRPEDVAGYGGVPDWRDHDLVTCERRRVLREAIADFELGRECGVT